MKPGIHAPKMEPRDHARELADLTKHKKIRPHGFPWGRSCLFSSYFPVRENYLVKATAEVTSAAAFLSVTREMIAVTTPLSLVLT